MQWIYQYQLFLFDLDGLLVNTEELHFKAYVEMCRTRGYHLPWDFVTYYKIAQQAADAPKRFIYQEFPKLELEEPRWEILYAEKKRIYLQLLENEPVPLLPGAKRILNELQKANICRCIVTHSQAELVRAISKKNPILQSVPHWFTREDYERPKPSPDGYLKAISTLTKPDDKIIGFEDSSRGLRSLMATKATSILINAFEEDLRKEFSKLGVRSFLSLEEACNSL